MDQSAEPQPRPLVAEGHPCPVHGRPSRQIWLPVIGAFSQCSGCEADFLAWYAAQGAPDSASAPPALDPPLAVGPATPAQLALV